LKIKLFQTVKKKSQSSTAIKKMLNQEKSYQNTVGKLCRGFNFPCLPRSPSSATVRKIAAYTLSVTYWFILLFLFFSGGTGI
jgi:hypothetical protein